MEWYWYIIVITILMFVGFIGGIYFEYWWLKRQDAFSPAFEAKRKTAKGFFK